MAIDVTIAATDLVANTATADLVAGGTAVAASETFRVKVVNTGQFPPRKGGETKLIFLVEEQGSGAATVTFGGVDSAGTALDSGYAGEYPPSLSAQKGTVQVSLAQADMKAVVLEAGRFLTSDGYITGTVGTNDCKIAVLRLPPGY